LTTSYSRGHKIYYKNNRWYYCDNNEEYNDKRPCKKCGNFPTKEGYDSCIGYINGAKSACCGHGVEDKYICRSDIKIEYYKNHPIKFAEKVLGCKLNNWQKLMLNVMTKSNEIIYFNNRFGNVYMSDITLLNKCILYPNTKILLCGNGDRYKIKRISKNFLINKNNLLQKEIKSIEDDSIHFKNGSRIIALSPTSKPTRSNRSRVIEYVIEDPEATEGFKVVTIRLDKEEKEI